MNADFWRRKRVLVTGHTGFKGAWLSLWLQRLDAAVAGYALPPSEPESLFRHASVDEEMECIVGDIRNLKKLRAVIQRFRPDIVFHLAAQPLVRVSYEKPAETFAMNVMGTVNMLEAVRTSETCRVVVSITSDKCYDNKEWVWSYRECDAMGGRDPYSSSKGCAELAIAAYRCSFFDSHGSGSAAVASARAGNVIGGGDYAKDRLIPDWMAAQKSGRPLIVRNPDAVRPWQHVLEPLYGYLLLAEKLWENPGFYSQAWNFGPAQEDMRTVRWLIESLNRYWGNGVRWELDKNSMPHEARLLMLDSSKARTILGWKAHWTLDQALAAVVDWYKAQAIGTPIRDVVMEQIESYQRGALADTQAHRQEFQESVA